MLRSTWTTSTPGRRCALLGASAAVVCLGGMLTACGGGAGGDGYVATGAAGGPPRVSDAAVAPTGEVTLVPLDEPERGGSAGDSGAESGGGSGNSPAQGWNQAPEPPSPEGTERRVQPPGNSVDPAPDPAVTPGHSTTSPGASPTPPSAPPASPSPAKLTVSDPVRKPTDKRWCEKVTLDFHNTGGTAIPSGTVAFGTHVIGALGIDWATIESTAKLPAPLGPGARKEKTWTVCVDAWRVPLGMHIETRDVTVRWE
ncbi:hypothetical protein [Streptomyces sp. HD]|uniref:hypothetical protein n=1 Tax=Streptomyces sp. HD TaxID=3020892 RepID=UPI00232CB678|nr:hypothetical protein [Streptomyces sp. HD]MDC0772434.1 hypothetical protein [Streptomyces sp. HD]